MYKKCGIRVFSFPGLFNIACCKESKKNSPNALCATFPDSPRLVHTNVIFPFFNTSSKLILLYLLHKIVRIDGALSKFYNLLAIKYAFDSVSALPFAFSKNVLSK